MQVSGSRDLAAPRPSWRLSGLWGLIALCCSQEREKKAQPKPMEDMTTISRARETQGTNEFKDYDSNEP